MAFVMMNLLMLPIRTHYSNFKWNMWWNTWNQSCGWRFLTLKILASIDQVIDRVVSITLQKIKNLKQVSTTINAFMTTYLPHKLIELLENIVFQNFTSNNKSQLPNL